VSIPRDRDSAKQQTFRIFRETADNGFYFGRSGSLGKDGASPSVHADGLNLCIEQSWSRVVIFRLRLELSLRAETRRTLLRAKPTWNSDQYLKFAWERTQPAVDLAARIDLASPAHIADLGCGPGNSTAVLVQRWPAAELLGVDNSTAMLASARRDFPGPTWVEADVASWIPGRTFDVVFSNATLQWVPDHAGPAASAFCIGGGKRCLCHASAE
jgi:SAM-dependent methyltransferase